MKVRSKGFPPALFDRIAAQPNGTELLVLINAMMETLIATRGQRPAVQASAVLSETAGLQPWNLDHAEIMANALCEARS